MSIVDLLGDELQGQDGAVKTETLLDCETVGLYFSAHWCPPCRGFTPKLAEKYEQLKKDGKKIEIVFISGDKSESDFDSYFKASHPWLALKFSDKATNKKVNKKFKVRGIPTLVFVNPNDVSEANTSGREAVMTDSVDGTDCPFPYKPLPKKTFADVTEGAVFVRKGGKGETTIAKMQEDGVNYLMLYFSAHWCPPCRGFTPKLAEWYKSNVGRVDGEKKFECAFVSSDRDQATCDSYWNESHGDYPVLKFEQRSHKEAISSYFGVRGIPTLAVVDLKTGATITTKARNGIVSDPEAKEFPWAEKPAAFLGGDNIAFVNEFPMLIAFADHAPEKAQAALDAVKPVAEKKFAEWNEKGADHPLKFAVENGTSGFADRLRSTMKVEKGKKVLAIFSIPDEQAFFAKEVNCLEDINEDIVNKFVANFLDEANRGETLEAVDLEL